MTNQARDAALQEARRRERASGTPHYVVSGSPNDDQCWDIVDRQPFLGEWYSSDGVRHG